MEERGHAERHFLAGLEPVAASQHVGGSQVVAGTFSLACYQRQGGHAFGPLSPQRLNLLVDPIELRQRGAPKTEDRGNLRGTSLLARDLEDFAHARREGIGNGVGVAADAEAEAPKVVVLI